MKKFLLPLILVLVLVLVPTGSAFADTSDDVTVYATPAFIGIAETQTTWTLDSFTGDSKIAKNTTYYANPNDDTTAPSATVLAGECYFDLTNTSSVDVDLYVTCTDFTGGSDPMTNGNTGTAGAGSYGAWAWYAGMTYSSKACVKTSGSDILYDEFSGGALDWGAEIATQTDDWTGGTQSTATLTISAVED